MSNQFTGDGHTSRTGEPTQAGANAGQGIKGVFAGIDNIGEQIRGTINQAADQLGETATSKGPSGSSTTNATNTQTTGSGFSKDAEAIGNAVTGNSGSTAK